jgi:hypothetical protein
MTKIILAAVTVSALAANASAQQVSTYTFERRATTDQAPQVLLDKIDAEQGQIAVQSKTTLNAPYSGEATTESTQVLADGNRIVHRTTTRVSRDSAGRTRKETLDADGQVVLIAIADPTTGTSTVFDPRHNTVSHSIVKLRTSGGEPGTLATVEHGNTVTLHVTSEDRQVAEKTVQGKVIVAAPAGAAGGTLVHTSEFVKSETTKEDLGQQTIEGVSAAGTRSTTVIPAGAVGNEQPIRIVSEEWFSPELQVLVLTRHSDPRTGETTYRLSGITRTEPAKTLFEMPAGK